MRGKIVNISFYYYQLSDLLIANYFFYLVIKYFSKSLEHKHGYH
jgi:hypothetical protein